MTLLLISLIYIHGNFHYCFRYGSFSLFLLHTTKTFINRWRGNTKTYKKKLNQSPEIDVFCLPEHLPLYKKVFVFPSHRFPINIFIERFRSNTAITFLNHKVLHKYKCVMDDL